MKKAFIILCIAIVGLLVYGVINNISRQQDALVTTDTTQPMNGTYCYSYQKDDGAIYDSRTIQIDIRGTTVTGQKSGSFRNSEYSVGYTSTLGGTINTDGTIDAVAQVVIADGGQLTQEERYLLQDNSLVELTYPYTEDFANKILRINETVPDNGQGQAFPLRTVYESVVCSNR